MTEALLTGEPQTPTDGKTAAQAPAKDTSSVPDQGKQPPVQDASKTEKVESKTEPKAESKEPAKEPPKGLLDAKVEEAKTEEKSAVPEKYDLKLEGDIKLSPAMQKGAEDAARGAGLTNDQFNKLMNPLVKSHIESQKAAEQTTRDTLVKGWSESLSAHKTLGGEKLEETLANARKSLTEFLPDEKTRTDFEGLLRETGLQYHPALIELLANVRTKVGGDKIVTGGAPAGANKKSRYPNSNMVVD